MPIPLRKNLPVNVGDHVWIGLFKLKKSENETSLEFYPEPLLATASVEGWSERNPFLPICFSARELTFGRKVAGEEVFYFLSSRSEDLVAEWLRGLGSFGDLSASEFHGMSRHQQAGFLLSRFVAKNGYVPHLAVGHDLLHREWFSCPWKELQEVMPFEAEVGRVPPESFCRVALIGFSFYGTPDSEI